MNNSHPLKNRLLTIAIFFGVCLVAYFVTLYNTQIIHGSEYRAKSVSSNAIAETVEASRGIITDRNGKVLVSNRLTYTLKFSDAQLESDKEINEAILALIQLCRKNHTKWVDTMPVSTSTPYKFTDDVTQGNIIDFCKKKDIPVDKDGVAVSAKSFMSTLRETFQIGDDYSEKDARQIAGVRYEMTLCKIAGSDYVFAEDVSVRLISQIMDGHYAGVTTGTSSARVYDTKYAAHILGRIVRIYQEDWDKYKELGYSMDALVGKGGAEEAFEKYLHGSNGTRLITTDSNGKITGELYAKEPQPGSTVALTLDIDLQEAAEKALAKNIEGMIDSDSRQRGGAVAVMEVGTGDVLALASYPTYDLSKFDELYDDLIKDKRLPMFNRAVNGTYAPGSTFKMCTSVAALESGIITPQTIIRDQGIYKYYSSPQPRCWIYNSTGGTHGSINVSQAITVSCNYFFYEVGRLTGIKTLDNYAKQFGLGESTGIEIGDSAGVLASPEYAESAGLDWTDGQTITAAIGQSYHLFTPLQLANYMATLAGDGEHYQAHLLKNVRSYDNSELEYVYDKEPQNVVEMSSSTIDAVKTGMHQLTKSSLASQFSKCVVEAGAKTGSAQVGTDIANGAFVCFAPYDDPQIAVAIVIEKGGSGAALASTAVDVVNAYFSTSETETNIIGENTLLK